jgi:hypothetical protein
MQLKQNYPWLHSTVLLNLGEWKHVHIFKIAVDESQRLTVELELELEYFC